MVFLLPIAVIAVVAVFLGRMRADAHRRNAQSWESLMAQLRLDWSARELSDGAAETNTTPEAAWQRMEGPKGLCVMYQNAKVMLEMADYAARNSEAVDRKLLETLRSDAMHIRVYVGIALGQYAFRQLNESICVNAYRAASMYVEMADRMTELLQVHAAGLVPDFSAAM
jgi:hypothetical protein